MEGEDKVGEDKVGEDMEVDMVMDYKNILIMVFYVEARMEEVDNEEHMVKDVVDNEVEDKVEVDMVEDKVEVDMVVDKAEVDKVADKRMITFLYLIAILYFD